jgi:hypothetical protein
MIVRLHPVFAGRISVSAEFVGMAFVPVVLLSPAAAIIIVLVGIMPRCSGIVSAVSPPQEVESVTRFWKSGLDRHAGFAEIGLATARVFGRSVFAGPVLRRWGRRWDD